MPETLRKSDATTRPQRKWWWGIPFVNAYLRAGNEDLDPATVDLRQTGEFMQSTAPSHAINLMCWRRSALIFSVFSVIVVYSLEVYATTRSYHNGSNRNVVLDSIGGTCNYTEQASELFGLCTTSCSKHAEMASAVLIASAKQEGEVGMAG